MNATIKTRCRINWNVDDLSVAFALAFTIYVILVGQAQLQLYYFDKCQESIAHSLGLNKTTGMGAYCDLPLQYCHPPIARNVSNSSEICINKFQTIVAWILPFILNLLQMIAIQQIFSLSGNHRRFIIYVLWAICILIFIGITITICYTNCFQVYLIHINKYTGGVIYIVSLILMIKAHSRSNADFEYDLDDESEKINEEKPLWNEVV